MQRGSESRVGENRRQAQTLNGLRSRLLNRQQNGTVGQDVWATLVARGTQPDILHSGISG